MPLPIVSEARYASSHPLGRSAITRAPGPVGANLRDSQISLVLIQRGMTDFFPEFEDWGGFVSALGDVVDLEATAREAQSLLRLAMLYGPCGFSLRSTSAWATSAGIADLSDVSVLKRLRVSANWLVTICQRLLADKIEVLSPDRPVVSLVDGTTITGPGKNGQEWRLLCRYGASGKFQAIEITDKHSGESYKHFPVQAGDIVIGDRAYARPSGLEHILDSGADFIVRSGWRAFSLRDRHEITATLSEVGSKV